MISSAPEREAELRRPPAAGVMRLRAGALVVVLALGALVFAVLAVLVSADPRRDADAAVTDAARTSPDPQLTSFAAGPLDALAEPVVVVILAAAAAVVLVHRRWWLALIVLALGLALTGWLGTELKEAFDRMRPAYNLDEASGPAFPSGHARFSFFWSWLAVTIAVHVPLTTPVRRTLIGAGLALTAAGGLARIYVGAHWLSDVIAGWALSAAIFAGVTLLAMAAARRLPLARRPKAAEGAQANRRTPGSDHAAAGAPGFVGDRRTRAEPVEP